MRLALAGATCALPIAALRAQRARGPGEDAQVLARGAIRVESGASWSTYNELFASGRTGAPSGRPQRLGASLTVDTLGADQIESVGPVQSAVRTLARLPGYVASLGRSALDVDARVLTLPITMEIGLGRRVEARVTVPYVVARHDVFWDVNAGGRGANLGLNPAFSDLAVRTRNAQVLDQLQSAAARLESALVMCAATPAASGCAQVNANRSLATQLRGATTEFTAAYARVYGSRTMTPAPFAPVAGSSAQVAIDARIGALNALYRAALGLPPAAADPITGRPAAAPVPVALSDLQRVLTDSLFGVAGAAIEGVERRHLGNVEVGAKILLHDAIGSVPAAPARGVRLRSAAGVLVRLGTATEPSADVFTDIGTGAAHAAVELRSVTDVAVGPRLWGTAIARYGAQLPDTRVVRVPGSPAEAIVASYRRHAVRRDVGDYVELGVMPRYAVTEYLQIAAEYRFRRKGEDRFSGAFTVTDPSGAQVQIDPAVLGVGTAATDHRIGGGFVFSTVAAYDRQRARLPLEVSFVHTQDIRGSGGSPKLFTTEARLRVYLGR